MLGYHFLSFNVPWNTQRYNSVQVYQHKLEFHQLYGFLKKCLNIKQNMLNSRLETSCIFFKVLFTPFQPKTYKIFRFDLLLTIKIIDWNSFEPWWHRDSIEPFEIMYSNSCSAFTIATKIGKWVVYRNVINLVRIWVWKHWTRKIIIPENSFVIDFSKCITVIDSINDFSIGINFNLHWVPIFMVPRGTINRSPIIYK